MQIYQQCRTPAEIQSAFDELQTSLGAEITDSMKTTRQKLLENFDEEVNQRLKVSEAKSKETLSRFEQLLMNLTKAELGNAATFGDNGFELHHNPTTSNIPLGRYELPRRNPEAHYYRLSDTLAQYVIETAKYFDS